MAACVVQRRSVRSNTPCFQRLAVENPNQGKAALACLPVTEEHIYYYQRGLGTTDLMTTEDCWALVRFKGPDLLKWQTLARTERRLAIAAMAAYYWGQTYHDITVCRSREKYLAVGMKRQGVNGSLVASENPIQRWIEQLQTASWMSTCVGMTPGHSGKLCWPTCIA